jgi:O-antigen/teichoic acid export membrane protein
MSNKEWIKYLPYFIKKRVDGRHDLQKVIGNTSWLFFDKILRMGVGLLVGAWVARYLGPAQFGLMNYVGSFVAIFSVFATLGLDSIVVRNIVRDASCRDEVLGSALTLKLTGGLVTFLLSLATIFFIRPGEDLTHWLVAIIATGTIFQAFDTIDFWFQSQVQSKLTVYARNSAFLAVTGIRVGLILMKAPLIAFACANLAEIVLASLGLVIVYRRSGQSMSLWKFSSKDVRDLLKDSWPLILSGVVIMIYMRIDQIMLGQMVGDGEVGVYSAAVRLAEVWYFVPMSLSASVFPSVVEARALGDERFYKRLQKFYNLMALVGYAVALPVTFIATPVVELIFGASYSKAGPMLAVLIWAGLFVNLGVARGSFLTTMNWTRVYFMTVLLGCIVNVVLNFILIPRYGGLGASIATLVGYWVAAHGSCYVYRPLFKTGNMLTRALIWPRLW